MRWPLIRNALIGAGRKLAPRYERVVFAHEGKAANRCSSYYESRWLRLLHLFWSRIRVPDQFTLHQLHRVLQIIFSHLDYHLYAFQLGSRHFEIPDSESAAEGATATRLCDLVLSPGSQFTYLYDFGDGWEHHIAVEAVLPMPLEIGPD